MASNFNSALLGHNMLFPVSTGVFVSPLQIGNFKAKAHLGNSQMSSQLPMTIVTQDVQPVCRRYLNMISTDLTFSDEVIENRCLHMMPYNEKYFAGIFQPKPLKLLPKRVKTVDKHKKKSLDSRHYLKTVSKPNGVLSLEEKVKNKSLQCQKPTLLSNQDAKKAKNIKNMTPPDSSVVFMTEVGNCDEKRNLKLKHFTSEMITQDTKKNDSMTTDIKDESIFNHQSSVIDDDNEVKDESKAHKNDWDDYLLSELSQLTANWIVHECTPADKQQEKLSSVLESWYGHPTHTDLVREEISDADEKDKKLEQKPKKKWKKAEASVLARVYNIPSPPAEAADSYSDNNKDPFYRQPVGVRKKTNSQKKKKQVCAVNKTATNISLQEYVETPRPKLKDFLNPQIGDKIFETDNLYQQEWLTGKSHVYNVDGDTPEILMETDNKYKKQLQQEMPLKSSMWYSTNNGKTKKELTVRESTISKPKRGMKRWISLPQPVNDTELIMTMTPVESDSNVKSTTDSEQRQKIRQNHSLVSIAQDWRSKWFMCGQYADSTPDELIRDMADIQPHVRLKAIGTVAKAAENNLALNGDHELVHELPKKIVVALECLLDDNHDQVRKAAAVTLYTLDCPNDKAKEILREMLISESEIVRWTSAHCLAHFGECDSDVVAEVIKQILSTESAIKYEQGIDLLVKISNNNNLVHCMVAEQLNSSSWRHRIIACKILPTLFGSINKDITQKLSNMMWYDWHVEVRNAAAQCLGKTSHGRDVHNSIKDKLLHGTEKEKLEAISKLGQLGIMTAKLLPAFLLCFANPYVSIRCEVCITCGNLQIKEEQAISCLVHLATLDQSWRVKALAIQALGKIGEVNDEIKECLLWAVRFEDKSGVRAEACHSLVALSIQDDDVVNTLQERLLVESSHIVRNEITDALDRFGLSATEDSEMVTQVKSEVLKLCHPSIITSQIIVNEMDDTKRTQLQRMVCLTEEDVETLHKNKDVMLERIRSQVNNIDSRLKEPQPSPMVKTTSNSNLPDPISREMTAFTSAADMELEALLGHDKSGSWSESSKSRPFTRESVDSNDEKDDRGKWQEEGSMDSIIMNAKINKEMKVGVHSRVVEHRIREKLKRSSNLPHYLSLPHLVPPTSGQDDLRSSSVPPILDQDDLRTSSVPIILGQADLCTSSLPSILGQDNLHTSSIPTILGKDDLLTSSVPPSLGQNDLSIPSVLQTSTQNHAPTTSLQPTSGHEDLSPIAAPPFLDQNDLPPPSIPQTLGQNNLSLPSVPPTLDQNGLVPSLEPPTLGQDDLSPSSVPPTLDQDDLFPPSIMHTIVQDDSSLPSVPPFLGPDDLSPPSVPPTLGQDYLSPPSVPPTLGQDDLPPSSGPPTLGQNDLFPPSVPPTLGQDDLSPPSVMHAIVQDDLSPPSVMHTIGQDDLSPPSVPPSVDHNDFFSPSVSVPNLKYSRLHFVQSYDHKKMMRKDVTEKEMFNKEISAIYLKLDARYADLSKDLIIIDKGYNTKEFSSDNDMNSNNFLMSADEIPFPHVDIKDTLSRNGKSSRVTSDINNTYSETQEILLRDDETSTVNVAIAVPDKKIEDNLPKHHDTNTCNISTTVLGTKIL